MHGRIHKSSLLVLPHSTARSLQPTALFASQRCNKDLLQGSARWQENGSAPGPSASLVDKSRSVQRSYLDGHAAAEATGKALMYCMSD